MKEYKDKGFKAGDFIGQSADKRECQMQILNVGRTPMLDLAAQIVRKRLQRYAGCLARPGGDEATHPLLRNASTHCAINCGPQ